LKGLFGVSAVRQDLMKLTEYIQVEERLNKFLTELQEHEHRSEII